MTSSASLPDIATLPSLPTSDQTAVLNLLFEPSPALETVALPVVASTSFESYDALIDNVHRLLSDLAYDPTPKNRTTLHNVLGSHPRLGARHVDSAQSAAEQASLRAGGTEVDAAELATLNARYEDAFPGLRYVVFVDGRGTPEIMEDMRDRIARGDFAAEERAAIQAMCDIAKDRARKLQGTGSS
ncbi:hypothetical protein ACRALDRAFT_2044197 [Sodiomyces alcalophilus JCM 7366]|uniref:uncharacterized protein n=1 Tax=Sodiomyces alcalophilus JCM 7366 TaxID=591952 RepID=UPI0039B5E47E